MPDNEEYDLDDFMGQLMGPPVKTDTPTSTPQTTSSAVPFDNSNEDPEGLNVDDTSDGWVADKELSALVEERSKNPELTDPDLARKIIEEGAPAAAKSVVRLAIYSKSESIRLRSAQYVIDKATDGNSKAKSALETLFDEVTNITEAAASTRKAS